MKGTFRFLSRSEEIERKREREGEQLERDIESQRRAAERPSPELRARLEAEGDRERRAIEAEVDALVGDHDDVDTLPQLELRVPPMDAPLRALLWFAIRRSFSWLRNRWQARQLLALAEAELDARAGNVDMRRAAAKAAEQRQRIAALRAAKRGGGHQPGPAEDLKSPPLGSKAVPPKPGVSPARLSIGRVGPGKGRLD